VGTPEFKSDLGFGSVINHQVSIKKEIKREVVEGELDELIHMINPGSYASKLRSS
jgi:hypothetical protein